MAESNTVTGARRTLGEQLRSLRAAAGVTQQGLAEKVGYSRSTVANVEVGRQAIDRAFWEGCDEVLNANGLLKDGFDQVEQLHRAISREAAESVQRARIAQISEWKSGSETQNAVSTTTRQADTRPAVQIIHKAFTGVDDLENADSSAQVPDLEARVLEAFRHNEGRPTGQPSVTLVGGFAGSGKSEFARFLSAVTGWPILDKDTLTRGLAEQLLIAHGADVNDRHSELYLTKVRPYEYRCMMDAALENLACGLSSVLTAPFVKEFTDESWLQRTANRFAKHNAKLTVVWVKCDIESMRDHIEFRGAARDAWKMANWDDYLASINPDFEPTWPHYTVDNRLNAAVAMADQAREIALRVRNAN